MRKIKYQISTIVFFLIILINMVNAYEIQTSWQEDTIIKSIDGANVINKNGALESKILMDFHITENYSIKHPYLYINFDPWEHMYNKPIEDVSILICDHPGSFSWNSDTGYMGECNKTYNLNISTYTTKRYFIHNGEYQLRNYTEYRIKFFPHKENIYQKFIFLINYTLPNFVFKQGDYYVAWLRFPNMKDKGIEIKNSIVLPSKDDIPRFIPNTKEIKRKSYWEDGKIYYRWTFILENGEDKILWYWNDKEIKKNEEKIQTKYTILGVFFGAIAGFILAILLLFSERLFFDWLPYGNKINRRIVKRFNPNQVIGNINRKKYHRIDCVYADNIKDRNKRPFKDKELAQREGYIPCTLCNPNE